MTVSKLKSFLSEALEFLEEHDDDEELNVRCNTYMLPTPFVAFHEGYISLNDMFKEEDEEEY